MSYCQPDVVKFQKSLGILEIGHLKNLIILYGGVSEEDVKKSGALLFAFYCIFEKFMMSGAYCTLKNCLHRMTFLEPYFEIFKLFSKISR